MARTLLATGGARSGKSTFARQWCEARSDGNSPLFYIATARRDPNDAEMDARIQRHQDERSSQWMTAECPLELPALLRQDPFTHGIALIDCCTLWLTNVGDATAWNEAAMFGHVDALVAAISSSSARIALVTNEVGSGIVPMHAQTRIFRDVQGFANQRLAAACDAAVLLVCGLPQWLKGRPSGQQGT